MDEKKLRTDNLDEEDYGADPPKGARNWKNTILKMLIDSITLGAVVNTVAFLVIMGMLKGNSYAKIYENVRTGCGNTDRKTKSVLDP